MEELNEILKANRDMTGKLVRIELSYYRDTHKSDVVQQPDWFKNNVTHDKQSLNLSDYVMLLSNSDAANGPVISSRCCSCYC